MDVYGVLLSFSYRVRSVLFSKPCCPAELLFVAGRVSPADTKSKMPWPVVRRRLCREICCSIQHQHQPGKHQHHGPGLGVSQFFSIGPTEHPAPLPHRTRCPAATALTSSEGEVRVVPPARRRATRAPPAGVQTSKP